jgi:hypothetical protein
MELDDEALELLALYRERSVDDAQVERIARAVAPVDTPTPSVAAGSSARWGVIGIVAGIVAIVGGAALFASAGEPVAIADARDDDDDEAVAPVLDAVEVAGPRSPARDTPTPTVAAVPEAPVAATPRPSERRARPARSRRAAAAEPPNVSSFAEEVRLIDAAHAHVRAGQLDDAERILSRYASRFGARGHFDAERLLLTADVACRRGDPEGARERVRELVARHPGHAVIPRARKVCP